MHNAKAKIDKVRRECEELKKMKGAERIDLQEAYEKEIGEAMAEMQALQ